MISGGSGGSRRGIVVLAAATMGAALIGGGVWLVEHRRPPPKAAKDTKPGPLLPAHLADLVSRMLKTPLGGDGGPGPFSATTEKPHADRAKPAASGSSSENVEGAEETYLDPLQDGTPGLRAYPARFAVSPGEALKVSLALSPELSLPEVIRKVTLRRIGPSGPEGEPIARPAPDLAVAPRACRSFFGTGCAFDQTISISTEGLGEGAYLVELATAESATSFAFLVRSLTEKKRIQVVLPDWTSQAYSTVAGGNLYGLTDPAKGKRTQPAPRVLRVSLDRYVPEGIGGHHDMREIARFGAWLRKERASAGLLGDADVHAVRDLKAIADVIVLTGHGEYWTADGIANLYRFQEQGGHILNLSGNTAWWQVRYENRELLVSKDQTGRHAEIALGQETGFVHKRSKIQIDDLLGASFRYGGFSVERAKSAVKELVPVPADAGVTVLCGHPALAAAKVTSGSIFGETAQLIAGEIDGLPLEPNGAMMLGKTMRKGGRIRALGKGVIVPLYYSHYKEASRRRNEIAVMVEYQPGPATGRVMSLSSMGAVNAVLALDAAGQSVILGLADYLLAGKFDDAEVDGCRWQTKP